MGKRTSRNQRVKINHRHIEKVLDVVASFLHAAGVPEGEAEQIFSSSYRNQREGSNRFRKIEYVGSPIRYDNTITQWMRNKRFLDATGGARPLRLSGKNSFTTLVKLANPGSNPSEVLAAYKRYGTVRRTKKGEYALIVPYFHTATPGSVAYEPLLRFLSDASTTIGRMIKPIKKSEKIESFWRLVDNTNLSKDAARRFTIFVRERSQTFLEELDEWLEANSIGVKSKSNRRKPKRAGLGLFSVYSD